MNPSLENEIYAGILLAVNLQLFLLGLIIIFTSRLKSRQLLLGFLCYVVSAVTIYNIFWFFLRDSFFANLFLAGYKSLYIAPLLYLYIFLLADFKNEKKMLLYHLSTPTILSATHLILKFGFKNIYIENYNLVASIILYANFLIYIIYLVLMYRNRHRLVVMIPVLRKKYFLFYNVIILLILIGSLHGVLYLYVPFLVENYNELNTYVYIPSNFIICFLLILFTISENNVLKNFFTSKSPYVDQDYIDKKDKIEKLIQQSLIGEKRFKNVNLKLKDIASEYNLSSKALGEYLRFNHKKSFNEFINDLRIGEFKSICHNSNVSNLSISGIAYESGFKSKATFYRIFKEKEGMSPGEYLKRKKS